MIGRRDVTDSSVLVSRAPTTLRCRGRQEAVLGAAFLARSFYEVGGGESDDGVGKGKHAGSGD